MGYYTRFSGWLEIVPPLTPDEVEQRIPAQVFDGLTVWINADGTRVEPYDDSVKAYEIEDELAKIVDAFPDRSFTGWIQGVGEEQPDIWRIGVVEGMVRREKAIMRWPDGTEVTP
jgi:hypothetical protein